ncbi:MAG TPA: DNA-processing protein DprA [Gammaproteobacteria bacterium]|jgi:DNA processing protein|nr:DNA-processing protein DprA [Gammaproteobacteria bacterium]
MVSDAWLALLQASQLSPQVWLEALKALGSAEALLAEPERALLGLGLPAEAVGRLRSPDDAVAQRWRRWLAGPNRSLVTFGSPLYPPRLAEIQTAPLALWVEGPEPALLAAPQLAMVGSRNPTTTGRETAEQFARYLSARGLTITSGLATGIDGASHRGALPEIGTTIAVLGSGPDVIFPRAHERLAADIGARGLVVSEFPPGTEPQKFFFPQRNRVIAGLALGTLVVEATRRSGSLITARWATDFGREVFAIPGSIHNPLARGCHWLIRQGAKLVEEAADVLVELAPQLKLDLAEPPPAPAEAARGSGLEADSAYRNLLNALDFSPIPIGDLATRVQLTAGELSSMLLILELEGLVEALPGGRYARLGKRSK